MEGFIFLIGLFRLNLNSVYLQTQKAGFETDGFT